MICKLLYAMIWASKLWTTERLPIMAQNTNVIPMKEWMQRSTLNFMERNSNAIMAPINAYIGHEAVFKTMAKTFEVVSRDAHYITIASRIVLAEKVSGKIYKEEEVFKAETAIHKQFEVIHAYLDSRIRQAEQKLSHAGIDPNAVERTTRTYEAKCSTRTAKDYIELLTKADIYLAMHQYLWIMGELSDNREEALKAKLNNERDVRNHLYTISRTTTKHFDILRRICNSVLAERKLGREKQSARDKRKYAEQQAALEKTQREMNDLAGATAPEMAAA